MRRMILLRHGQSEFNVVFSATKRDPGITDPHLTDLGRAQIAAAAEQLAGQGIRRIVASPYTRALQTAAIAGERLGVPVLIDVVVRERCAFACDIGTKRAMLAEAWPHHDFAALDEVWWPQGIETEAEILARAARFRAAMAADPAWRETLVVSHWGFILALTGEQMQNGEWVRCDPTGPAPAEIDWLHA